MASEPEFAASVHKGRAFADAKVARGLYERAVGFQHKVERNVLYRGEEKANQPTRCATRPTRRHCIFWLRNRGRQSWQASADDADDRANEDAHDIALLDAAGERARRDRAQE